MGYSSQIRLQRQKCFESDAKARGLRFYKRHHIGELGGTIKDAVSMGEVWG